MATKISISTLDYKRQDWIQIEKNIAVIQDSIVKAVLKYGLNSENVKNLQKSLIKSLDAKKLAFKIVLTSKEGKTAGLDNIILTKDDFSETINKIKNIRSYKCGPVKKVIKPKFDVNNQRPLEIPNYIDRIWQALFNLAFAPVIAVVNCPRSYGYIKNRCCGDAVARLKNCLYIVRQGDNIAAEWVIKIDIKGFFEDINHKWLMDTVPLPYKHFLEGWLKAGAINHNRFLDIESEEPQGCLIGPSLVNWTLAGLEKEVLNSLSTHISVAKKDEFTNKKKWFKYYRKLHIIRYADEIIITCRNRHDADEVIKVINTFLYIRGLYVNSKKTSIISVYKGFEFLGFNFKHYGGKRGLLVTPSQEAKTRLRKNIRDIFKDLRLTGPSLLIMKLNSILKRWANYYRICTSTRTFTGLGFYVWHAYFNWLKHKFPKAGLRLLYKEYFSKVKTRTGSILLPTSQALDKRLTDVKVSLFNIAYVSIVNLQKMSLDITKNSYLLEDAQYFEDRQIEKTLKYLNTQSIHQKLLKTQKGVCPVCSNIISIDDEIEIDHILPLSKGGKHKINNMRLLHKDCHRNIIHSPGWKQM